LGGITGGDGDFGDGHPPVVQHDRRGVELAADVAALAQRVVLVLLARRDPGRVDGLLAAQGHVAPRVTTSRPVPTMIMGYTSALVPVVL
jgi:hypothetical protein